MGAPEIVDSSEQAAELDQAPLIVREPLEEFLDSRGLGSGPIAARAHRRGALERDLPRPNAAPGGSCCAAPRCPPLPPSAHDVLREARLLRALEDTAARTPRGARHLRGRVGARRVPFYVIEEMHGHVITSEMPAGLDSTEGAGTDRRRAGRRPGGGARRGLGGLPGSRGSASPPATSNVSCGASTASGSTTRLAS